MPSACLWSQCRQRPALAAKWVTEEGERLDTPSISDCVEDATLSISQCTISRTEGEKGSRSRAYQQSGDTLGGMAPWQSHQVVRGQIFGALQGPRTAIGWRDGGWLSMCLLQHIPPHTSCKSSMTIRLTSSPGISAHCHATCRYWVKKVVALSMSSRRHW